MNILLADGDEAFRDYLGMIIEEGLDCELYEVSSGNEALTIFEMGEDIDLVISELDMKGGNGNIIYSYIRNNNLNIPFIWITETPQKGNKTIESALKDSAYNDYIPKPFKDADLFPVIEKAMEKIENQVSDIKDKDGNVFKDRGDGFQDNQQGPDGSDNQSNKIDKHWKLESGPQGEQDNKIDTNWSSTKAGPKHDPASGYDPEKDKKEKRHDNDEVAADWSLEKKKQHSGQDAGEADWSLEKKKQHSGQDGDEADWSLGKKKQHSGQDGDEADWSLEKKEKKAKQSSTEEREIQESSQNQGQNQASHLDSPEKIKEKKAKAERKKQKLIEKKKWELLPNEPYIKVKTKRFLTFSQSCCDIFIKLPQRKFIKLFHGKEDYDKKRIIHYLEDKKQTYLYIRKENYQEFQESFSQLIFSRLSSKKKLSTTERSLGELLAYEHIHEQIQEIGISEAIAKQSKQAIDSSLKLMKDEPSLFDLFNNVMRGKDFISEHSLLLTYICNQICTHTSWRSQSTLQKLSMACLLHDIGLTDPELAKIEGLNSPAAKELSDKEREVLKSHPNKSAEIIRDAKNLYPDVDVIVAQHHETPDEAGFPRGLPPANVSPLTCIFIIAEDYALQVIGKKKDEIDIDKIIAEFEIKYKKGNFRRPLEGFIKGFKK